MKREELIKLKEDIAKLSPEEEKKRKEYLRKLATGEYQGPPVGYTSIDQTFLMHYDEEKFLLDLPHGIFFDSLCRRNKKNLLSIAFNYFLTPITYKKFFKRSKELVKALYKSGVRDGNYIGVCIAGIPESMYSLCSCSYLGGVGIFFPPYLDRDSMLSDLTCKNTKILFIMDYFYKDPRYKETFDYVIENSNIERVVIVPTLNSSILKVLQKKEEFTNPKFVYYNDFIKAAKKNKMPKMVEYTPDKPLAVTYSSGSMGILKGVILSNDAFVNSAESYTAFGFNLAPGQKFYHVIPPFTSTGLIANATNPLYYGSTLYQNPTFDPVVYSKNLGIHRLNWGIATTELFNGIKKIIRDKSFRFWFFRLLIKLGVVSYKNLNNAYIGGTVSTKIDREELNEDLRKIGANAKILSSYGTSENGSIVTAELPNAKCTIMPEKSVGVPLPGIIVMAVDKDGNELPTGVRGELAVHTNSGMIGYYNRPNLDEGFFMDVDKKFNRTHDIGFVTKEGFVIYCGRGNDISTVNGNTFYNFDVKDAVFLNQKVRDCEVLTNNDGLYCAHIVFDKTVTDIDEEIKVIQDNIYETFNSLDQVPLYFKIRDSFPMASSTKRDYPGLKKEKDGFKYYEYTKAKQYVKK